MDIGSGEEICKILTINFMKKERRPIGLLSFFIEFFLGTAEAELLIFIPALDFDIIDGELAESFDEC